MNYKTIIIFLFALLFLVPKNLLYAQNNTMERDLKITRKPDPVYLPGFGVMYGADLRRANFMTAYFRTGKLPRIRVQIDSLRTKIDTDTFNMDSIRVHIDSIRIENDDIRIMLDSLRRNFSTTQNWDSVYSKEIQNALQQAREQYKDAEKQIRTMYSDNSFPNNFTFTMTDNDSTDYKEELDKSLNLIKEVMINYGGTLTCISHQEIWLGARRRVNGAVKRTEVR